MRVAAIIYFEDGATVTDAKAILINIKDKLDRDRFVFGGDGTTFIDYAIVDGYDPEFGSPVWYIP